MPYDRPLFVEFITSFVFNVSYMSGKIFSYGKNKFPQENNFSHKNNIFTIGYLEFPTEIKRSSYRNLVQTDSFPIRN